MVVIMARAVQFDSYGGVDVLEVRDVARQMVAIAHAGLKRRRCLDRAGEADESHFINALAEFVDSGRCPAQEKLEKFHGAWGGKIDPLFTEYAF